VPSGDKYGPPRPLREPRVRDQEPAHRNLEYLTGNQFAKVIDTLDIYAEGQQVAVTWIAKKKHRNALNLRRFTGSTTCERDVRAHLHVLYDWCAQHDDIPELVSLTQTVSR
jgi:hypothetical protein